MSKYCDKSTACEYLGISESYLKDIVAQYGIEVRPGYAAPYNLEHIIAAANQRSYGGNKNASKQKAINEADVKKRRDEERKKLEEKKALEAKAHALALEKAQTKSNGVAAALKAAAEENGTFLRGDQLAFGVREDLQVLHTTLLENVKANGTTTYTDKGTQVQSPDMLTLLKVIKLELDADKGLGIGAGNRPAISKDEVIDDDGISEFIN